MSEFLATPIGDIPVGWFLLLPAISIAVVLVGWAISMLFGDWNK